MVVQSTKHKAYYSIRIEGMSNSIKVLKRVAYDMPNFRNFRARILHCCSKGVPWSFLHPYDCGRTKETAESHQWWKSVTAPVEETDPERKNPPTLYSCRNAGSLSPRANCPNRWWCDGASNFPIPQRSRPKETGYADWGTEENAGNGRKLKSLAKSKGAIIHHPEVGALRSPKAPRRRAVIFRSHGLLQIIQGTLRFPCAGCRQLPFCGLAIWGHLALQAVPSRQVS